MGQELIEVVIEATLVDLGVMENNYLPNHPRKGTYMQMYPSRKVGKEAHQGPMIAKEVKVLAMVTLFPRPRTNPQGEEGAAAVVTSNRLHHLQKRCL
jgi:hypothetical protein